MISNKKLLGSWKNSKASTKGIASFSLAGTETDLSLMIHGAHGGVFPMNIGPIALTMHANDSRSNDCIAFHGNASFGDLSFSFAGNINKGLIIIASYISSSSDSSQNTFIREFFYKLK